MGGGALGQLGDPGPGPRARGDLAPCNVFSTASGGVTLTDSNRMLAACPHNSASHPMPVHTGPSNEMTN